MDKIISVVIFVWLMFYVPLEKVHSYGERCTYWSVNIILYYRLLHLSEERTTPLRGEFVYAFI